MSTLRTQLGVEKSAGLEPSQRNQIAATFVRFRRPLQELATLVGLADCHAEAMAKMENGVLSNRSRNEFRDRPLRKLAFEELVGLSMDGTEAELGSEAGAELALCRLSKRFQLAWRSQILKHAWDRLERIQGETSQPCFSVCRYRYENPGVPVDVLLENALTNGLLESFRKIPTKQAFRAFLYRTEIQFAKAVVTETAATLLSRHQLADELHELGLNDFRDALKHHHDRKRHWRYVLHHARRNPDF